ncbi:hypothetical protein KDX16_15770 [Burkholderia vietnamiensis]|jgi:hypothetical protein|uniref:Uncharacterized protein n=1 Tax=Burkholderia aenigmatica TaxID=2015348 RepID=A0A228HL75_9BURK|nr:MULTISPECIES: hypothetical protein [Burkholderia]HDR9761543.1 hypothetical protein [Burkholderia cepacia ATCC 25416]MBR7917282.1 hypothetical protein [Burkholderia vietnamiensis]MBR8055187.1 hypothetical protein [Burkholderia vietnamiensis]OXI30976.1 hypothetical protein CFB84_43230 [Burkholderia aenigmatica]VWB73127.1 hypothetical protein BLA13014_03330 [Burkholderia aenigmatica]
MLTEAQLKKAVEAFCNALPAGQTFYAMHALPRVGFGDTEAKPVMALVLAETEEDFRRFEQVFNRGITSYREEFGLSAKVWREIDMRRNGEAPLDVSPENKGALEDETRPGQRPAGEQG